MKSEGFAAGGSGGSGDFGSAVFLFLPIEHSVSYNMDLIYEGTLTKEALTMIEGRIYNFSAGPSILPEPVLLRAQKELLNCGGSGMSVLEMSHRSKVFDDIINAAEENLRKIMGIPDNYKILQ